MVPVNAPMAVPTMGKFMVPARALWNGRNTPLTMRNTPLTMPACAGAGAARHAITSAHAARPLTRCLAAVVPPGIEKRQRWSVGVHAGFDHFANDDGMVPALVGDLADLAFDEPDRLFEDRRTGGT